MAEDNRNIFETALDDPVVMGSLGTIAGAALGHRAGKAIYNRGHRISLSERFQNLREKFRLNMRRSPAQGEEQALWRQAADEHGQFDYDLKDKYVRSKFGGPAMPTVAGAVVGGSAGAGYGMKPSDRKRK